MERVIESAIFVDELKEVNNSLLREMFFASAVEEVEGSRKNFLIFGSDEERMRLFEQFLERKYEVVDDEDFRRALVLRGMIEAVYYFNLLERSLEEAYDYSK